MGEKEELGAASGRRRLQAILERLRTDYDLFSTAGGAWALVVPSLGARILAAGAGEQNAFWVAPTLEACLRGSDWNAGGQRTWLAPELGPRGLFGRTEPEWRVPPALDPGSYLRVEAGATGGRYRCFVKLRAKGKRLNLEIERALALEDLPAPGSGARGARIRFEHTLINRSGRTLEAEVGLWSILQVPALPEGTAFLPAGPCRLCYGQVPEGWARNEAGRPALRTAPGRRYKLGLPGSGPEAALSHLRPAGDAGCNADLNAGRQIAVGLRTPVDPDGRYVDRPPDYAESPGDVLQLYNSPLAGPEAFCELECHAPAPVLAVDQSQSWPVEFLILEGPPRAAPWAEEPGGTPR